jgi:hypothetical protein
LGGCALHATLQMPKADHRYNSTAGTAKGFIVALKRTERLSSTMRSLVDQHSTEILRGLGGCALHTTLQMPKADYRYNSTAGTAKAVKHIRHVHKLTWNERKGVHTMYMSAAAQSPVSTLMIARQHILPTLQPNPGELSAPSPLTCYASYRLSFPIHVNT